MSNLVPVEVIANKIFLIKGQKVMLSMDLAKLYGVEARVLMQAVKRNIERFPEDFMFQLSEEEFRNLKSQIVISSWGGARRARPYAFTEQGVAMLSSVLKSKRAVAVNISIMRVFSKLKQLALSHSELLRKVESLERKFGEHDKKIALIFEALKQLLEPPLIRGQKVMLGRDLAGLYGVSTGRLNEQVKRNLKRFPDDFMFQLTGDEFKNWKSQIAMSNSDKMGLRRRPFAFTENGIAMLSGVLNSERAIAVNIQIMRTFTQMRRMMLSYKELKEKIEKMESK